MTLIRSSLGTLVTLLLLLLAFPALPAVSQAVTEAVLESSSTASVDFPRGIDIQATIELPEGETVERVELYFHPVNDPTLNLTYVDPANLVVNGATLTASAHIDLQVNFLPSGIDLAYYWRVVTTDGRTLDTAVAEVGWVDPRFDWVEHTTDQVRLFSYALSDEFAQATANTAQETITALETRFDLPVTGPISIWIYDNATDFQPAKPVNSRESIAGASYPGDEVIHAIIGEGNEREVGRTVTHEISHQVLYQAMRSPYGLAPLWFDEGMATHAQTEGIDGYLPLAIAAATSGRLYQLASLEAAFPYRASDAPVAYAISWCAVELIRREWGDEGIAALIDQFAAGTPTEDALQAALGVTPAKLDAMLRDWLIGQSGAEVATPPVVQ